ncbi:hypothetical protein BH11PSE2_BH11PSE2_02780 [soil metagenome]
MSEPCRELKLRLVVEAPIPGVRLALQDGKTAVARLTPPMANRPEADVFDCEITVKGSQPDGSPRLPGSLVQGPSDGRFIYINVGTLAGDPASPWQRRIKLRLAGIDWPLIEKLAPGERLEARIAGRGRDGTPACASVPLLAPGWRAVAD